VILEAISQRLLASEPWRQAVLNEARAAWQQNQNRPNERKEVESALAVNRQQTQRLLDAIEGGNDGPEVAGRLAQRRKERQELERQLAHIQQDEASPKQPPTEAWVFQKLSALQEVLAGKCPAAALALRGLIGTVTVTEMELPGRKRKCLRGAFTLTSRALAPQVISGKPAESNPEAYTEEIVVCFASPPPWAAVADQVKTLFDAGHRCEEIAAEVPCPYPWVAKALAWWYGERGLPVPDGRKCKDRRIPTPEREPDNNKGIGEKDVNTDDNYNDKDVKPE
jgi:hypothetical protein